MSELDELKNILLNHDPKLKKMFWNGEEKSYTVWTPHHPRTLMSSDLPEEVQILVTINRYTKDENDNLHEKIYQDLTNRFFNVEELKSYYEEETGYYRHIIECYVLKN